MILSQVAAPSAPRAAAAAWPSSPWCGPPAGRGGTAGQCSCMDQHSQKVSWGCNKRPHVTRVDTVKPGLGQVRAFLPHYSGLLCPFIMCGVSERASERVSKCGGGRWADRAHLRCRLAGYLVQLPLSAAFPRPWRLFWIGDHADEAVLAGERRIDDIKPQQP